MVSEYLEQAGVGEGAFVIRAEPSGVPTGVGSLSIWVELVVHLRRFIGRDEVVPLVVELEVVVPRLIPA